MTPESCVRCGTQLPPDALACPACASIVHADELKRHAAEADVAERTGDLVEARHHWATALALLPAHSRQHAAIRQRLDEIIPRIAVVPVQSSPTEPWWRRAAPGLVTAAVMLVGKLKFLLLGLTKASTFVSMFAFFGVYWATYGWPLALGLVLSIYVHEMGHVAMLRRLGIDAGAPMFIPGVGAFVMLKQVVADPLTDARIGLAGPVWGLGAALAAFAAYLTTGARIWLAIAQLAGLINLFNLIPVWQLDGARGFHVLTRTERWIVVAAIVAALALTEQPLLIVVGAVAMWRAMQHETGPGNLRVLATFVVLVVAFSWLARGVR